MKISALKKGKITTFVPNPANWRDDLDIPSMEVDIVDKGRIVEPLYIEADTMFILKGNRRGIGGNNLYKRTDIDADLREALENVPYFLVSDLTEKERTELTLDHGSQKPLSRVETIKAVWRLAQMMYSEKDIIQLLYHQLAGFTGQPRKAYEASQLPAGPERNKYLSSWLHGTVGNYLLTASQLGPVVREQVMLTELASDRALTDAEKAKVKFKASRKRVNELNTAKEKDRKSTGWNPDTGGVEFNALLVKFEQDDKNPTETPTAPTKKAMTDAADRMQSGFRLAFLKCAGELPEADAAKMVALDGEYYRWDKMSGAIRANLDKIQDERAKALLTFVLFGNPDEVEAAIAPFAAS